MAFFRRTSAQPLCDAACFVPQVFFACRTEGCRGGLENVPITVSNACNRPNPWTPPRVSATPLCAPPPGPFHTLPNAAAAFLLRTVPGVDGRLSCHHGTGGVDGANLQFQTTHSPSSSASSERNDEAAVRSPSVQHARKGKPPIGQAMPCGSQGR